MPLAGLFISATDTEVGKTYVGSLIARQSREQGIPVGVYKPVASGCESQSGELVSQDAVELWNAAGRPESLEEVCPQRFLAPVAPHLAAKWEGRSVDLARILSGLKYWQARHDFVIVEGAGGLLSPITDGELCIDIAKLMGLPLVIVVPNRLGAIHHGLSALHVASTYQGGVAVAALVLNKIESGDGDQSLASNRDEIARRCKETPILSVNWRSDRFHESVDWRRMAAESKIPRLTRPE